MFKFFNGFASWLRRRISGPADSQNEPAQIIDSKVLLLVYNPVMPTGKELSEELNWYRVDDLITGFITDVLQTSGGLARYHITQRVDLDEFPAKTDGFRYTPRRTWMYGAVLLHLICRRRQITTRSSNNSTFSIASVEMK